MVNFPLYRYIYSYYSNLHKFVMLGILKWNAYRSLSQLCFTQIHKYRWALCVPFALSFKIMIVHFPMHCILYFLIHTMNLWICVSLSFLCDLIAFFLYTCSTLCTCKCLYNSVCTTLFYIFKSIFLCVTNWHTCM